MDDRTKYDQNGGIYDIVCGVSAKLDSLVKSLTDDPKLIRTIRDYARRVISNEVKEGVVYVDMRVFYCFIYERYLKKYPELEDKIPIEHQVKRVYFAVFETNHAVGVEYNQETYERISQSQHDLLKENAALKIKADKWDSFCAKSGKK